MAVEVSWEAERLLWVRYYGTVSAEELLGSQSVVGSDGRFDDVRKVIVDTSGIEKNLADGGNIEKVAAMSIAHAKTNSAIHMIVVLHSSENGQSLAAYYQFLSESTGWKIELVKTELEARERLST